MDLWAIASNGDALLRQNVHSRNPEGTAWSHVPSDVPFQSISLGENGKLWAIGNDGHAYFRIGLSEVCPSGQTWLQVQRPGASPGSALRQVSVGHENLVWALDVTNRLYLRLEVTRVFPEGTCWHLVCSDQVKSISAHGRELWATLDGISPSSLVNGLANALQGVTQVRGIKARRSGITPGNLFGSGWDIAVGVSGEGIGLMSS